MASSSRDSPFPSLSSIRLVVFDMAGTTVDDTINGQPLVTIAFIETFASHNPPIRLTPEQVNPHRGKSKKEALKQLLLLSQPHLSSPSSSTQLSSIISSLFIRFESILDRHLNSISKEQPGTTSLFRYLQQKGILVAVGSGFSEGVVQQLVKNMGWNSSSTGPLVSYIGSVDRVSGKSRPDPAMIFDAMKILNRLDPKTVIKVGDTVADIEEGKNAGVRTIGVWSGTQTKEQLAKAGADWVCSGVKEIEERWRKQEKEEKEIKVDVGHMMCWIRLQLDESRTGAHNRLEMTALEGQGANDPERIRFKLPTTAFWFFAQER